jgi:hypothetical protein
MQTINSLEAKAIAGDERCRQMKIVRAAGCGTGREFQTERKTCNVNPVALAA